MGWCDESGEHEGWVQPIFNDGEAGTGTSNGTGIVFDAYTSQERVRPYSEITHLRMVCECGEWKGTTVALADLPADHYDPLWRELTDKGEEPLHAEWRRHVAPFNAVHQLAGLADEARVIDDKINEAVRGARSAGASWSQIGAELGMTKQGAQQKYGA